MPEMLLEVGCEELPASYVSETVAALAESLLKALAESGLQGDVPQVFSTPRRLIVGIENLPARQPDQAKRSRGPGLQAAFDPSGNPSPALLGFCRSQGADIKDIVKEGEHVWLDRTIPGKPTGELLAELIPAAIKALTFEKTMRWGDGRMRFARPIRWILAAFDAKLIDFELEGVQSGFESRGHRFYHPGPFPAHTFQELVEGLRKRHVEPDATIRADRIEEGALRVASQASHAEVSLRQLTSDAPDANIVSPMLDQALVKENANLTEWPTAILGEFKPEFQELPVPVLVTAMAHHERMFPVHDAQGALTNKFVFIRNSGEDDTVRAGAEWVLNARFNDAKFFFDEDKKRTLEDFLELTSRIVFHEKLGTVRERADRLADLAEEVAKQTGAPKEEIEWARQAARLCKADLSTGLVSELTSLQGVVGGEYARREGLPDAVWQGIAGHYKQAETADEPGQRTAARVLIADQLDRLAGFLSLGQSFEPKGSSDPFALRKAATTLIEAAWQTLSPDKGYEPLFLTALGLYKASPDRAEPFYRLMRDRYSSMLPEFRYDRLEAAMPDSLLAWAANPTSVKLRLGAIDELAQDEPLVQCLTRPLNILAAAEAKKIDIAPTLDPKLLDSPQGEKLLEASNSAENRLREALKAGDAEKAVRALRALEKPINDFFDSTMVMAEDENVRKHRLALVKKVANTILLVGDFSKLVQD